MIIIKAIFLQIFWYICVYFGPVYQLPITGLTIFLIIINYRVYKPKISLRNYIFLVIFFCIYGVVETLLFSKLSLIKYEYFPLWLISLYVIFICYYGDIFNYLEKQAIWLLSLIGGVGGAFAFWGGVKISGLEILNNKYYFGVFISWSLFFPISIILFKKLKKESKNIVSME